MDYVKSLYRITYSPGYYPWVLLDFGQWAGEELTIDLDKSVELVPLADSKDIFIRDAQTSVWSFSIKAYTTEALDLAARVAIMQAHIGTASLGKQPLRLEVQGHTGHYWQWSSCFVKKYRPVRIVMASVPRWEQQFDIVATGLSYI